MTDIKSYSIIDSLKSMSTEERKQVFTDIFNILRKAKNDINDITKKGFLFPLNSPEWDSVFDAYTDIIVLLNRAKNIASDMKQ